MNEDEKHSEANYLVFLGKRIKEIRLSKSISQTEIAYRCDFDKSNYNNIEAGKRNLTVISLLKISKALEIKLSDLLDF